MNTHLKPVAKRGLYTIYLLIIFTIYLSIFPSFSMCGEAQDFVNPYPIVSLTQKDKKTKTHPELVNILYQLETNTKPSIQSVKSEENKQFVLVDAIAKEEPHILLDELVACGFQPTGMYGRIISGYLPIDAFNNLYSLSSLNEINISRSITEQGSVTSKGDRSQKSYLARQYYGVDGGGITIGVISDSYNCLGGASTDKQSKDLPEQAISIEDALDCTKKTDEGRALMQIIHDIAPGAHLIFHSGANGLANAANAILKLAFDYKADIIVDDQKSLSANYFQSDVLSQAAEKVVRAGVVYVTAAGNSGRNSYESFYNEYINIASEISAHDFDHGTDIDIYQRFSVPEGIGFLMMLQWDSPAYSISGEPGAQTDLDIFMFNEAHTEILASSAFGNIGRDPVEVLSFFNPEGSGQTQFDLMITKSSGPSPRLLKYIILNSIDGLIQEFTTSSSAIFGQANSKSALTVGAVDYAETPVFGTSPPLLQYFSSAGGTLIKFDINGAVLSNPYIPNKPDVVAPDNVSTTFFGIDTDNDGFPNISGTSAAAPHVAGVTALLLEINPALQPVDIKQILQKSAIDIFQKNDGSRIAAGTGFDFDSGFGLIDSEAAVSLAKNYKASDPEAPIDGDMNPITVNQPDQVGGGGAIGTCELIFFVLFFLALRKHLWVTPWRNKNFCPAQGSGCTLLQISEKMEVRATII